MISVLLLLRALHASPAAERDPEAWATRFMAHTGLGCVLWLVLVGLVGSGWASAIAAAGYAGWEAWQWPGGARMAFDGLLDWVAFASALTGQWAAWHGQGGAATGCGLAALVVVWVGVWRRARP